LGAGWSSKVARRSRQPSLFFQGVLVALVWLGRVRISRGRLPVRCFRRISLSWGSRRLSGSVRVGLAGAHQRHFHASCRASGVPAALRCCAGPRNASVCGSDRGLARDRRRHGSGSSGPFLVGASPKSTAACRSRSACPAAGPLAAVSSSRRAWVCVLFATHAAASGGLRLLSVWASQCDNISSMRFPGHGRQRWHSWFLIGPTSEYTGA